MTVPSESDRRQLEGPPLTTAERRRIERRDNLRVADLSLPEFRRMVITSLLGAIVLGLFLWMVRTVIIAGILATIMAVYLRPLYDRINLRIRSRTTAALLTLALIVVPVLAVMIYSIAEIREVATYVGAHNDEIAQQIHIAVRRIPGFENASVFTPMRRAIAVASGYGSNVLGALKSTLGGFAVAITIFLFTVFYVFTQRDQIVTYIRSKLPPRYGPLSTTLTANLRGVMYGAIYATLVTQTVKSIIILLLNLIFGVPLAVVLAVASFVIGFFPIVGSWSIYVPVAGWLLVFAHNTIGAVVVLLVGFFVNTIFISTYLRPKLAAERSGVLDFYWMLVALITGVYTFGLPGILLGPILIGLLKGVVDTVSTRGLWQRMDDAELLGETEPAHA
jgi:predicted PurR-regulated permease PerM